MLVICRQHIDRVLCGYRWVESWPRDSLHTWCEGVQSLDGSKTVVKSNLVKPSTEQVRVTGVSNFLPLQLGIRWLSYQHRCTLWLPSASEYGWSHVKSSKAIAGKEETGRLHNCINLVFLGNYGKSPAVVSKTFFPHQSNYLFIYLFNYWLHMQNIHRTLWKLYPHIAKNMMAFNCATDMGCTKWGVSAGHWFTRRCLNGCDSVPYSHCHGVMYFLISGSSVSATGFC